MAGQRRQRSSGQAPRGGPLSRPLGICWFPRDEWGQAAERWPDLLDELPAAFDDYRREIEARTKRIGRHLRGQPLQLTPITVSGLEEYARGEEREPGTAECRAAYAALLVQHGEGVLWPPERNDPCWCGSGRKYKQCCGPVPEAPEPSEEFEPRSSDQPGDEGDKPPAG